MKKPTKHINQALPPRFFPQPLFFCSLNCALCVALICWFFWRGQSARREEDSTSPPRALFARATPRFYPPPV